MNEVVHISDVSVSSSPLKKIAARGASANYGDLIGESVEHTGLMSQLNQFAKTNLEILLVGETGVGKELYAKFVHLSSSRKKSPFIPVNCGAIPDSIFENEMFGHAAGAYTDGGRRAEGLISAAEGGTLFLDEVDSLSQSAQVKVLRLLQEKEYRRLGDTRLRKANVRFLAAMNVDPQNAIEENRLRVDLYYRLNAVEKHIPPLRERSQDIMPLAEAFAKRFAVEYGRDTPLTFTHEGIAHLMSYDWPGNVRELLNVIRSLTCSHEDGPVTAAILAFQAAPGANESNAVLDEADSALLDLPFVAAKRRVVDRFERFYIENALRKAKGNITHAADTSGKNRRAFFELMKKHGIKSDL
jgi:DNA-binding NtrC family response regulator